MTREIPLTNGLVALVDDEDYASVAAFKWYANPNGQTAYAKRKYQVDGRRRTISLHAFLTGWGRTDHRNLNGLDNRRANLREATRAENSRNRRRPVTNKSGFKGVDLHHGRWRAAITKDGRKRNLGHFDTPETAALAYDAAARELHGEFAALNFPGPGERSAVA